MKVKIIIALSVLLIPVLAVFLYPGDEGNAAVSYTLAGMEMVVIPGGSFIMGSPENEDRHGTEEKQHKVEISGFSIGRYEVTQKQYRAITGKNPSRFKGDNLPVESIDWYDAVRFCNMLSKKYGLTEYYKINGGDVSVIGGDGFRLPTEAEWEFACRAGTLSAYYWGNSVNGDYAWYSDNSDGKTHPSGQKKPNGFGLYDMAGNVWEWCQDWSGEYAGDAVNPAGAEKGDRRILRGGGWNSIAALLRSANRMGTFPSSGKYGGSPVTGFRVARSAVKGRALIRECPDVMIINRMPGVDGLSMYYIVKGRRREFSELDHGWIMENCRFETKTVY